MKTKMLSKEEMLDSGGDHATILSKVFDMHRRSHHYSIRKTRPELYGKILSEIEKVSQNIVSEALHVYENSLNKTDNKKPHPNYFLAVCRRLKEEDGKIIKPKVIWGKVL